MTCEATLQLLPLHIGGDLSLDEAVAVEAHLQNCASCASESQSFQTSFDAMQMQALLEQLLVASGSTLSLGLMRQMHSLL